VPSSEHEEVLFSIERARKCLDGLVVRGLSTVAAEALGELRTLERELERVGAAHLAERLRALATGVGDEAPEAPRLLLMAQTSLRVFERVLTLQAARAELERWVAQRSDGERAHEADAESSA
jgi:hypothetical protein